mmetsp:Transcript_35886/g.112744  ORF Transcript_35886/g.112744 Transcript_35886/m.112744 type:complete len:202 (-) Transcript_35886:64-669(-)
MRLVGAVGTHYHFDHVGGKVPPRLVAMVCGPFAQEAQLPGLGELSRDHGGSRRGAVQPRAGGGAPSRARRRAAPRPVGRRDRSAAHAGPQRRLGLPLREAARRSRRVGTRWRHHLPRLVRPARLAGLGRGRDVRLAAATARPRGRRRHLPRPRVQRRQDDGRQGEGERPPPPLQPRAVARYALIRERRLSYPQQQQMMCEC